MKELDDFNKCVTKTIKDGYVSIRCKLGLWCVRCPEGDTAYKEAFHYWKQYESDGEYHEIIGGESVMQKLMKTT